MFSITSAVDKLIFDKCEFGYENIMLRDYGKDHTDIDANSKARYSQYIGIDKAVSYTITNCYIDAACVSSSGDGSGNGSTRFLTDFSIRTYVKNLDFTNNTVYSLGNLVGASYETWGFAYNTNVFVVAKANNTNISGNNIHYCFKNNEHQARSFIWIEADSTGRLRYENNVFDFFMFQGKTEQDLGNRGKASYDYLAGYEDIYVKNNQYNFDNDMVKCAYGRVLVLTGSAAIPSLFQRCVDNLTIKMYTGDSSYNIADKDYAPFILDMGGNYSSIIRYKL